MNSQLISVSATSYIQAIHFSKEQVPGPLPLPTPWLRAAKETWPFEPELFLFLQNLHGCPCLNDLADNMNWWCLCRNKWSMANIGKLTEYLTLKDVVDGFDIAHWMLVIGFCFLDLVGPFSPW